MKNKLSLIFFTMVVATVLTVSACSKSGRVDASHRRDDVDYYTCPMHPSVRSREPNGKCPICSMDLIPVLKRGVVPQEEAAEEGSASDHPREFTIPLNRQQLIGVTYAPVTRARLTSTIRAVGTVAVDKQRHWDYVARVDGYVNSLKVFSPGEAVGKGQILMDLYSPDLTATQNEFLELLRMRDAAEKSGDALIKDNAERLLASARQRLRQWNISDPQIAALGSSRASVGNIELTSPFAGIVQAVDVDQGRRVMAGDHLIDIADLSHVWVWAEFYQEEIPLLKTGMAITLTSSALPGEKLLGNIALIDPFLNDQKRTGRVRIEVENSQLKLRPEMYVDIELIIDQGEALSIPLNAVLPTGKHNIVFVDKGAGKLEPRYIELGRKFGDAYAVLSGIKEGERVVTSANFLIDAESKVQGALKSW